MRDVEIDWFEIGLILGIFAGYTQRICSSWHSPTRGLCNLADNRKKLLNLKYVQEVLNLEMSPRSSRSFSGGGLPWGEMGGTIRRFFGLLLLFLMCFIVFWGFNYSKMAN